MWKTIEYTGDIMPEILDMTIEYYGKDNDISKCEFIEHEYFGNLAGKAVIKLAYDEEKQVLAGQYIVIPMRVKIGDKIYPVILSLNTLTRAAYRGQKIFITLAEAVYRECAMAGYKFCYGAPNPNSHPGFLKKLSFRDAGVMPLFLKIIHPSRLVKEKLKFSLLELLSSPFNLIFHLYRKATKTQVIEITKENVSLIDIFWNGNKDKYEVIGVRDSGYILWRYLNMPCREYKIFAACEGENIVGYVIGRITEVAGMSCGMLVDFMVEKGMQDAAMSMLKCIEQYFYSTKVGLMGCLMQKHFEEAAYLRKLGFFECPKFLEPQPFPIIYREFNEYPGNEKMNDFSNWFFTMGDYDVI